MEKTHHEDTQRFYEAVFEDICTIKEVIDISLRLKVADMLDDGKGYAEISQSTGASTATISRVNRCYLYGSDGYKTVLSRMKSPKE